MSEEITRKAVEKILSRLKRDIVPGSSSEEDLRNAVEPILEEFCEKLGIEPLRRREYTLQRGRADAVFNRLIIEFKRPGLLSERLTKPVENAIKQTKEYIEGLAKKERHDANRIAGVVFDGIYIIFIRYLSGHWSIERPVRVNKDSLEKFLRWLYALSLEIALTPENLIKDFSIEQFRTQTILRRLYKGLNEALTNGSPLVSKLFEQWRIFFSEAIDYSEAFGGRKLEPLKRWVRKAGLEIKTPEEAERFFFVLHTYFALLVKLIAWLAVSRYLGVKLGVPRFGEMTVADGETLRSKLKELEDGGIFRAYGIKNLLEGDFFSWYLHVWNPEVEEAIKGIIKRLDEYDPTTLSLIPEETRDLFKKLYHYLLPREIRHNLGEYYTPDWLAQRLLVQIDDEFFKGDPNRNNRLRDKLLKLRFLDPACGSGTFLVLIIARMIELGKALMVREEDLLKTILRNVVGFDLNPLAVLTARVNYLLAIADLLEYRREEITIPVYLADSVRTPAMGEDIFSQDLYEFHTAVGTFRVPAVFCTKERFDNLCGLIEECLNAGIEPDIFIERCKREIPLESEWNRRIVSELRKLYENMLDLHKEGMNGLWARLLKNNFAPLTVGQFDYIVGNPPWVNWENLPDEYRQETKPLWERYGLFPHSGMDAILGKGKKDISMIMTYTVIDKLLKEDGKLGFIITQSVFKTSGSGQGFRSFSIPKGNREEIPIKVIHVDDMVDLKPFEGASNRTAVVILQKGEKTTYPVPYTLWKKKRRAKFTYDSSLEDVVNATRRLKFYAEPVNDKDPTSPWLTARPKAIRAIRKIIGRSGYKAHEGVNTGGANAVYWVDIVYERPDGLVVVQNITEGAKVKVEEVSLPVEKDLLYPLLRGHDVKRWMAEPSAWILVVQDPITRRGIDEQEMKIKYPKTYEYLKRFEGVLRKRAAFRRYFTRRGRMGRIIETGPFYSMFDVGTYTFAPWKVVWTRLAKIEAAVVGSKEGKPVIPQETITLVDCSNKAEAHYIAALVNSSPFQFTAISYSQEGGKSMGSMHILEHIRIPRYDPSNPVHQKLAELSEKAHYVARSGDEKRLKEIEEEIDIYATRLWKLTDEELKDIKENLKELTEKPEE